jgi:hypothetical protein
LIAAQALAPTSRDDDSRHRHWAILSVPRCQGSKVPGCQGSRVPRFQGSKVRRFEGWKVGRFEMEVRTFRSARTAVDINCQT